MFDSVFYKFELVELGYMDRYFIDQKVIRNIIDIVLRFFKLEMLLGMRLEYLRIKFFMIENVSLFLK